MTAVNNQLVSKARNRCATEETSHKTDKCDPKSTCKTTTTTPNVIKSAQYVDHETQVRYLFSLIIIINFKKHFSNYLPYCAHRQVRYLTSYGVCLEETVSEKKGQEEQLFFGKDQLGPLNKVYGELLCPKCCNSPLWYFFLSFFLFCFPHHIIKVICALYIYIFWEIWSLCFLCSGSGWILELDGKWLLLRSSYGPCLLHSQE